MKKELSQEEKIDYIYNTLYKREKRYIINLYIKWGIRVFVILYLLYFYFYTIPALKEEIINSLKIKMPEINKEQIINKTKDIFNFDNK
ncbi:hypothetical protein CSA08_03165 [Candidatus Gracilibacteria bacterium]|nr:MAG: hypothetical protein CSA08_03165 [Candidatus Gracilibacteria bacterium]